MGLTAESGRLSEGCCPGYTWHYLCPQELNGPWGQTSGSSAVRSPHRGGGPGTFCCPPPSWGLPDCTGSAGLQRRWHLLPRRQQSLPDQAQDSVALPGPRVLERPLSSASYSQCSSCRRGGEVRAQQRNNGGGRGAGTRLGASSSVIQLINYCAAHLRLVQNHIERQL